MRQAAKTDRNQTEIVDALRRMGATVQSLAAVGKGTPDLLVGFEGETFLMEVKDGMKPPSARKLTPDQEVWHGNWTGGRLDVVNDINSAVKVITEDKT
jgi:hypothetical protein